MDVLWTSVPTYVISLAYATYKAGARARCSSLSHPTSSSSTPNLYKLNT